MINTQLQNEELSGNKYFKWYWNICNRAKNRILEKEIYTERHHIYPKSIYGENKELVVLTAREHYIVHLLLWQGFRFKYGTNDKRTYKMAYAFTMMNNFSSKHNNQRYNSNLYNMKRLAYYEASTNRPAEECSMYGKTHNDETKKKMSKSAKGKIKSKEHCKNISISHKGQIAWNKGLKTGPLSNEQRIKRRENMKDVSGINNWAYGKKQSKEEIEKRIKSRRDNDNYKWSDESKKKMSDFMKGEHNIGKNNPMYGKTHYDIWIEKYGKEEADRRKSEWCRKIKETKLKNKMNKLKG